VSSGSRTCEQCGTSFAPRREHARFCSAACRIAWNNETVGERTAELNALACSITAMEETVERLPLLKAADNVKAFAVVGEAVWWVTIVDATMVRYHPDSYDLVLATQSLQERELTEQTLAGLRFVRNQMSLDADRSDFIAAPDGAVEAEGQLLSEWVWNPMPSPAGGRSDDLARTWKLSRYDGYQARLAGRTVGGTFDQVVAFLRQATAAS
jgi:hypothetical protein